MSSDSDKTEYVHYTAEENINSIKEKGLLVSDGAYGKGVYLADLDVSFGYSKEERGQILWLGDSEQKQTAVVYVELPSEMVTQPDPSRPHIYMTTGIVIYYLAF